MMSSKALVTTFKHDTFIKKLASEFIKSKEAIIETPNLLPAEVGQQCPVKSSLAHALLAEHDGEDEDPLLDDDDDEDNDGDTSDAFGDTVANVCLLFGGPRCAEDVTSGVKESSELVECIGTRSCGEMGRIAFMANEAKKKKISKPTRIGKITDMHFLRRSPVVSFRSLT
jgi:hypothetical protein